MFKFCLSPLMWTLLPSILSSRQPCEGGEAEIVWLAQSPSPEIINRAAIFTDNWLCSLVPRSIFLAAVRMLSSVYLSSDSGFYVFMFWSLLLTWWNTESLNICSCHCEKKKANAGTPSVSLLCMNLQCVPHRPCVAKWNVKTRNLRTYHFAERFSPFLLLQSSY